MTVELHTLSNGFRIVTEYMPGLASASLGVWVAAGGRHEQEQENGVAHFLEHMAFKGTTRRSALQIAEEIEDVGGYLNAYTSRESTAYYARVLAEDTELALDVIADILRAPSFAEEEITRERGVILQEIGQVLDTPDDVIFDWLQEAAFPDQPMGRSILGPAERVKSFGRGHLTDFVGAHYTPGRMILSAAGAVVHDDIVRQAEALFGDMAPSDAGEERPARYAGGERRVVKNLEQAHFALALPGAGYRDPDFYAGHVFSNALGGGMSSRLFQEAREKRGFCYTIYAQAAGYSDIGMTTIYAGTGGDEIHGLAELTVDQLKSAAEDMTEAEASRARAQMKAGLLMGLESPAGRCERLARSLMIWGRVPPLEETAAKIDAVDLAATRRAGERLAAGAPSLALYGPVDRAPEAHALAARLAA